MFKNADDLVTSKLKLSVYTFVTGNIFFPFFIPEFLVGFGPSIAFGAPMPKAAINKDGNLDTREAKIRFSGQG